MKLRNKKTGEIQEWDTVGLIDHNRISDVSVEYNSIARLNDGWEDYEEPKERYHWFVSGRGTIEYEKDEDDYFNRGHKSIGNYFETKEEAEKAVEKLKAWKRLKDRGFKFVGWCDSVSDNNPDMALFKLNEYAWETDTCDDLDILFGGEE